MAEYNPDIIKPVESPHNITGLTPPGDRQQKKRRQHSPEENIENPQRQRRKPADKQNTGSKTAKNDRDSIDYCA
jgi:hypothetical protein